MLNHLRRALDHVGRMTGVDVVTLWSFVVSLPRFVLEAARFWYMRRQSTDGLEAAQFLLRPKLHDRRRPAGNPDLQYFAQDLWVAQKIFAAGPERHVDVGSRLDGFVAHIASFRELTYVDLRPTPVELFPNLTWVQADVLDLPDRLCLRSDSVSCLHTLEHIGLGRYGDRMDPLGHVRGMRSLAELVLDGGTLYVSVPVSGRSRIEFNSQRVFLPGDVEDMVRSCGLEIMEAALIDTRGRVLVDSMGLDDVRRVVTTMRLGLMVVVATKTPCTRTKPASCDGSSTDDRCASR